MLKELKQIIIILTLVCCATLGFSQNKNQLLSNPFEPHPFSSIADSFKHQQLIPSSYYVSGLGFFCKQEIKLEKATGIPIKIRLGNIEYCDWKEGKKTSTYKPNY